MNSKNYDPKDNVRKDVKHVSEFRVYHKDTDKYLNFEDAFLHEDEDGVIGIGITTGSDGRKYLQFLSGDDGHWWVMDDNRYDAYWILGLGFLVKYVQNWLRKNCDREKHDGLKWGWVKRK